MITTPVALLMMLTAMAPNLTLAAVLYLRMRRRRKMNEPGRGSCHSTLDRVTSFLG